MSFVGLGIAVAELELFVRELAVNVDDFVFEGYFVGHLDGEDGFAEVGVGKEAADFSFVPEFEVELLGVRTLGGVFYGLVGRLEGEHADFGCASRGEGAVDFGGECSECICFFLHCVTVFDPTLSGGLSVRR